MKVKLIDVCEIIKGKTTITKATAGEYPLVVTAEDRLTNNEYQFDCKAVCVPLVSATGHGHASIKRIHYQEGKFALGTILAAVIPKSEEQLNARYLHIYLSYFKDSIIVPLMRGSANVSLTIKSLGTVEIELPDIGKQLDIVEMVSSIEDKKYSLDQYLQEQENMVSNIKKEILQLSVQGKLVPQHLSDESAERLLKKVQMEKEKLIKQNKIKKEKPLSEISEEEKPWQLPESWQWVRLNDICSYIQRGKSPKYSEIKEIPVVAQKCIQWSGFDINRAQFIDPSTIEKYSDERLLQVGDLLWNSTGLGTLGRINIYPGVLGYIKVVADSHVTVIRPFKNYINYNFLFNWFSGPKVQGEIESKSSGSTKQTELNTSTVKEYIVPIPPLEEQKRIVEKVDSLMALCNRLEREIEKSKKYSEKLMESILRSSFKLDDDIN